MNPFVQNRYDGALMNAGTLCKFSFNDTGFKAYAFVVHKEAVCPSCIGETSISVYTDQIIRADEVAAVNHGIFKQHFSIQFIFTEGI